MLIFCKKKPNDIYTIEISNTLLKTRTDISYNEMIHLWYT